MIRHLSAIRLRRLSPFDDPRSEGSVIRYYWEKFLALHQNDFRGRGLEIGEATTLKRYGKDNIFQYDVMDVAKHSPEVNIVADLSRADHIASDTYDVFVNQFTTAVIYDVQAALFHSVRILKPGGVLLINFWCVDKYFPDGLDLGTGQKMRMYWWFTPIHVGIMLKSTGLDEQAYSTQVYGNLFTRVAFLYNMPARDLTPTELNTYDSSQPLLICVRVIKPENWRADKPVYRKIP